MSKGRQVARTPTLGQKYLQVQRLRQLVAQTEKTRKTDQSHRLARSRYPERVLRLLMGFWCEGVEYEARFFRQGLARTCLSDRVLCEPPGSSEPL
jgi:hypothetical protein